MTRHIAIDMGAESGRCVAGMLDGGVLQLDELVRFPTQTLEIRETMHWNIYRFYESVLEGLKEYVKRYGAQLDSIGVDTWGVDYGFIDSAGELKGLPYSYRDCRTQGTDDVLEATMGKRNIYELSGIQFLNINTLNQLVAAKKQRGTQFCGAKDLLFIPDIMHYLLGAKPCCEYTAASISQLVDTRKKQWSDEIADAFDLPRINTQIVCAGDCIGTLNDQIADEVGLNRGVKLIAPAVHDTASAAVAIPAIGENWAYISSGTWSLAGIELDRPIINDQSYNMNISNSGGALGKSLFLKNVMGLWIIQQCKRSWNRSEPELNYEELVVRANLAKPLVAFIDPDDDSFFSPKDMPKAVCDFIQKTGQTIDANDIGQIARIVYESLALKYRLVLERICDVSSKKLDALHITGGGSKNALLNQLTANAMGVPVVAGPAEGTAMGNLLVQAYGCGALSGLDQIREVVNCSSDIMRFEPNDTSQWQTAYQKFREICK